MRTLLLSLVRRQEVIWVSENQNQSSILIPRLLKSIWLFGDRESRFPRFEIVMRTSARPEGRLRKVELAKQCSLLGTGGNDGCFMFWL